MIDEDKIIGEGSLLWCVVNVDRDDPEDTTIQFWLANDIDHLCEQIRGEWEMDKYWEEQFEQDWGYYILPKLIGTAS